MSNRDPDAHYESLNQWFDFAALEWAKTYLHTVMPGIVESYDAEKKRATVQPAINLLLNDEARTTMAKPAIQNVPVVQTSGGGFLIQVPLKKGDAVLLFFSERGMDKFKETFEVADPLPNAFFDIRDAIAMPGFGAMEVTPVTTTGLSIQTEDGETYYQNGAERHDRDAKSQHEPGGRRARRRVAGVARLVCAGAVARVGDDGGLVRNAGREIRGNRGCSNT